MAEAHALDPAERRLRHVTLTLGEGARLRRQDDGAAVGLTERGALVDDLATRAFHPDEVRARMAAREAAMRGTRNVGEAAPA